MEVAILGPLEVRNGDGVVLGVPGATQARVVAALAAHRGVVVDAERLADMVGVSVSSLRSGVSRLRGVFGELLVDTVGAGYRLGEVVSLDADRFAALAERARVEPPDAAVGVFDEALALWRGEPLPELDGADWVVPLVVALVEQRAAATEERIESLIGCGRFADAVAASREHIGEFPFRDRPRGLLMRALAADGRQVEALRVNREYRSLLRDEVGTEPGAELVDLERRIVAGWHDVAPVHEVSAGDRAGNLRPMSSSFVGRDRLSREVLDAVRERRLVTLIGVGGVGKTRLAMEAGLGSDQRTDGVWMVELQTLEVADDVPGAVANTLAIRQSPGASMTESIVQWAQHRELLLILDNCEHVLSAAAGLVEAIIEGTDQITVLATSREPLLVRGEHVIAIPPLSRGGDDGDDAGAVELFIDRARDELASFDPEPHTTAIEEICQRLDGIPLAIELAAARVRGLTVEAIAARLDERFRLLTAGRRTAVERHATLRAAIDWSYDLLDHTQQQVFADVSVFAGPFGLDDAIAITSDDVDELDATDAIAHLVDRSLLVRVDTHPEYRLLETLRAYGRDRLAHGQRADELASRHVTLMAENAARAYAAAAAPDEADIVAAVVAQMADYSAAIGRAIHDGMPDTAVDIARNIAEPFFLWGAQADPTRSMLELADHDFADPEIAAANHWMASNWCMFFGGDLQRAVDYAHEAAELDPTCAMAQIMRAVSDMILGRPELALPAADDALAAATTEIQECLALMIRGNAALQIGDVADAAHIADRFLRTAERADHPSALAFAHHLNGRVLYEDDPDAAARALERGLAIAGERIPDCWPARINLLREMIPVIRRTAPERAARTALEALDLCMRHNNTGNVISAFAYVAMILHDEHRSDMAARALGAAGDTALGPTDTRNLAQTQRELRALLGDRYEELAAEGARASQADMTRALVTELRALRSEPQAQHEPAAWRI